MNPKPDSALTQKTTEWPRVAFGVTVTLGFFLCLAALITTGIPETAENALLVLIGVLAASFKDIVGYYFGSSSGSSAKQQDITGLVSALLGRSAPVQQALPGPAHHSFDWQADPNDPYRQRYPVLNQTGPRTMDPALFSELEGQPAPRPGGPADFTDPGGC